MSFFDGVKLIVSEYYMLFLRGIGVTMLISMIGTVAGFFIGLVVGVIRTIPVKKEDNLLKRIFLTAVKFICVAYVEIFRGTPLIIQAAVIYYGIFMGVDIDIFVCALIIVSINTGAYMAEIVRGGSISIDKGQFEGAQAIGMTHTQTMFNIIIPQVIRNILPSVANEFVINIKDTSVLNVIGFTELYFYAKSIVSQNYLTFETYIFVALVYFILTFTVTRILRFIEKKLEGKANYQIVGAGNADAETYAKSNDLRG